MTTVMDSVEHEKRRKARINIDEEEMNEEMMKEETPADGKKEKKKEKEKDDDSRSRSSSRSSSMSEDFLKPKIVARLKNHNNKAKLDRDARVAEQVLRKQAYNDVPMSDDDDDADEFPSTTLDKDDSFKEEEAAEAAEAAEAEAAEAAEAEAEAAEAEAEAELIRRIKGTVKRDEEDSITVGGSKFKMLKKQEAKSVQGEGEGDHQKKKSQSQSQQQTSSSSNIDIEGLSTKNNKPGGGVGRAGSQGMKIEHKASSSSSSSRSSSRSSRSSSSKEAAQDETIATKKKGLRGTTGDATTTIKNNDNSDLNSDLKEEIKKAEMEAVLALAEARAKKKLSQSVTTSSSSTKKEADAAGDAAGDTAGDAAGDAAGVDKVQKRRRQLLATFTDKERHQSTMKRSRSLKFQKKKRKKRKKNWAKNNLDDQLQMVQHEEAGYTRWWPLFKSEEIIQPGSTTNANSAWSILVHGRGLGLLSTKIAMRHRRSTVVTMKYQADDRDAHLALTDLLGLRNNLLCETLVDATVAKDLMGGMGETRGGAAKEKKRREQPFRYGVISLDVFEQLIGTAQSLEIFEESLGGLLSISATSFVELPRWEVLAAALDTILVAGERDGTWTDTTRLPSTDFEERYTTLAKARGSIDPWVGLLSASVQRAKLEDVTMRVLEFDIPVAKQTTIASKRTTVEGRRDKPTDVDAAVNVDDEEPDVYIKRPTDDVADEDEDDVSTLPPTPPPTARATMRVVRVDTQAWSKKSAPTFAHTNKLSNVGVDIKTLLSLGIIRQQRKELFKMYLHFPFQEIVSNEGSSSSVLPSKILYVGHGGGSDLTHPQLLFQGKTNLYRGVHLPSKDRVRTEAKLHEDTRFDSLMHEMTAEDTEGGEFSFIEYNSGSGLLSTAVAERYPRATIISVEAEEENVNAHLKRLARLAQSKVDIAGKESLSSEADEDKEDQEDQENQENQEDKDDDEDDEDLSDEEKKKQRRKKEKGKKRRNIRDVSKELSRIADVGANNWVCQTDIGIDMLTKLYESPEFVRYAVFTGDLVLEHMLDSNGYKDLSDPLGKLMSTAMTTFFTMPSALSLSLALQTFFHANHGAGGAGGAGASGASSYRIASHPRSRYQNAEMQILSTLGRVPGKTKLSMRLVPGAAQHMLRVDVIQMERHVHHHFDYRKDGHNRKYNMHVFRNDTMTRQASLLRHGGGGGGEVGSKVGYKVGSNGRLGNPKKMSSKGDDDLIVGDAYRQLVKQKFPEGTHPNRGTMTTVYITREHDAWHIPYGQLYGVTLITILRLGLVEKQREYAYHNFVALPLYEDMAPWNIVFQGSRMAYIDYDTKDVTFDDIVPLTYKTLSVLFNYKRTVEDFRKCGPSGHNPYGFQHINACIGET